MAGPVHAKSGSSFRVVSVIGTRPEAIKMAPVVHEIALRPRLEQQVIFTGQHPGLADMFAGVGPVQLREFACGGRSGSVPRLREALHRLLSRHFAQEPADLVLVHGDTSSAFAGALAARDFDLPIGHVEAGLRSFDLRQPWPEEGNRTAIDALSTLLFAPNLTAARNLAADKRVTGRILVTGNSGIDALFAARAAASAEAARPSSPELRTILVTCHRKENQGAPVRAICAALKRLVSEQPVEVVLPLHPNPAVSAPLAALLAGEPRIALIEPQNHRGMVALIERCWLILTDSGGLQEEGPALGKPVLVLRNVTERSEAVESDNAALVGTETETIVAAVAELLADEEKYRRMARPSLPFGDGRAAPRIAAAVEAWLAGDVQPISR